MYLLMVEVLAGLMYMKVLITCRQEHVYLFTPVPNTHYSKKQNIFLFFSFVSDVFYLLQH